MVCSLICTQMSKRDDGYGSDWSGATTAVDHCREASDRGGASAAVMATLIMTAKLKELDPQAWLTDVLARIASTPQGRLNELLPWERKRTPVQSAA